MANVYIYSGAAGAGTGANWANAYTTLAAALTAKAAGDDFWVAQDHAETQASAMTLTAPGTEASPNRIICVNRAGSVPPVSADLRTTATITTTGSNALTIGGGVAYWRGATFQCATGTNPDTLSVGANANNTHVLDTCALRLLSTGASGRIALGIGGAAASSIRLKNTTMEFSDAGQGISLQNCRAAWEDTASALAGTVPTTLVSTSSIRASRFFIQGVDLSALGSGKTLVGDSNVANDIILIDCKLGASVTVASAPARRGSTQTQLIRCDSGDTNYRHEKYSFEGTQTTETTIVRTGGASDGTTTIAWKVTTTADAKRYMPFQTLPISIWNETTGSAITLTIQGIWGGGAVPTDADIWMDVEYLGTSGFPVGSFASSGPADPLASGTNLSAGSGTWGGSTTKFALSKQITPQEKGPITVYIKAAAASSTFYIDPKITVS